MKKITKGIEFNHKGIDYVFRALSLSQMKSQLDCDFESKFFSRSSRRFHKDIRHFWSVSRQVLVITRLDYKGQKETIEYRLEGSELGKLTLGLVE